MPYTVKSITVSGFRGFNCGKKVDFSRDLVLLFGNNGSGKSSTLSAIEWCLFGNVAFVQYEGRTHDELISTFQNQGEVQLTLRSPDGDTVLERSKIKGREKTSLKVTFQDGSVVEDERAEQAVYGAFRLTFEDFKRSTFLHQESVRGLLTENPADRNAALDRLFGLDALRNITDGIRSAKISDRQEKLQNKINQVELKIGASLDEARRRRDDSKKRGKQSGLSDAQFEITYGARLVKDSGLDLSRLADEARFDRPSIEEPTSFSLLLEAAEFIQSYIRRIRKKLPERAKIDELNQDRTRTSTVLSNYSRKKSEALSKEQSIKVFEKEHGDSDTISARIKAATRKIEQLEKERSEIKSKFKVIKDAVQYLQETEETVCPVCGRTVQDRGKLLDHLKSELEKHEAKDIELIDDRTGKARGAKAEAENEQREHKRLSDETARTGRELEGVINDVAAILKRVLTAKDDSEVLLKECMARLDSQIKKYERPLLERENQLQRIEDRCQKITHIAEFLKEEENTRKFEKLLDSKELQALRQWILDLEALREILDSISKATTKVQTDLAASMIKNAHYEIASYYERLCDHPYYKNLEIEVQPRAIRGALRNEYYIKGVNQTESEETLASQKFSTGQMNCVALAIYLALAKKDIYSHNLGFLILDDPSQNLDTSHKRALAEILLQLVPYKQIIVATHDNELQTILQEAGIQKKPLVYRFGNWSKAGPEIQSEA